MQNVTIASDEVNQDRPKSIKEQDEAAWNRVKDLHVGDKIITRAWNRRWRYKIAPGSVAKVLAVFPHELLIQFGSKQPIRLWKEDVRRLKAEAVTTDATTAPITLVKTNNEPYDYDYQVHPLAALFPELPAEEFQKLKNDIQKHGQLEAIWINGEDVVLDGRHRLRACKELGIEPRTVPAMLAQLGLGTEADFIWSRNILRRHLTADQRAAIGHKWADTERQAAKERQKHHGGTAPGTPKNTSGESAQSVRTREAVAKKIGVTEHKVRQVESLSKNAPELIPKVAAGEMKLSVAVKTAKEVPAPKEKPAPRIKHEFIVLDKTLNSVAAKMEVFAPHALEVRKSFDWPDLNKTFLRIESAIGAVRGERPEPQPSALFNEEGALAQFRYQMRALVEKLWSKDQNLGPLIRALRSYSDHLEEIQKDRGPDRTSE